MLMNVIGRGIMKKENHSLTNFSLFFFFVLAILITVFSVSCTKTNEFSIGENFVESQTHLIVADTFSVDISTMLLDSVKTSNQQKAYAGTYRDPECGTISCMSYFKLDYQTFDDIPTSAVFDSVRDKLPFASY